MNKMNSQRTKYIEDTKLSCVIEDTKLNGQNNK